MSAESIEYHQDQPPRSTINYVVSTEVTDPSILESVADTVAGFINDVVPTSYTIPHDTSNEVQWAHLGPLEYDERESTSSTIYEKNSTPPLILVLGYKTGIQVWSVSANGLAAEVVPWRPGKTKVFRILPSPHNCEDLFLSKRPLVAICDVDSVTGSSSTLDFVSFKTLKEVISMKFKNNILDIQANKHSVVVSFLENIVVLDAFTLSNRCTVAMCAVIPTNPITLGLRWLAYTEKTFLSTKRSGGGCDNAGSQNLTTTVIECAKLLGKGIMDVGGSVVNTFTGNSTFKPGVVCPGSPQNSGKSDILQKGIVTILDIECDQVKSRDPIVNGQAVIAHFIAHNDPITSLKFDSSGMLLVTADVKGYDFHVFRIHPHPVGSSLASVHHLYILHRGDTSSKVQDMCFSPDSRWVTVSTRRGTTHVFPITPYGGPVGVRTHTSKHVVNKMSRYHRSAGLTGENRSNNPARSDPIAKIFPFANPRFPPYPKPTVVNALAQIKQPTSIQTSGTVQLRSTNVTNPEDSNCIAACFASPRDCIDQKTPKPKSKTHTPIESLFIIAYHGCLIQYDLDTYSARNIAKDRVCDDSPIELKTTPAAQWRLQRTPSSTDAPVQKKESYFEDIFSGVSKEAVVEQSDDYWLSQVEIVTHAGPHRRLWMGPQFTFKTYVTKPGSPLSITNVQNIETRRTHLPSTSVAQVISFDPETHASREFSPPYHNFIDEIEVGGDLRLEEDLADALMEVPPRDSGGRSAIVSMKPHATPVAKVVNPLGKVVTIQSEGEPEKEQREEAVIHENCDESLFRPIVAPKPLLSSEGKPRSNPTDIMMVRSLDDTTEVVVKILDKNIRSNNSTAKGVSKYSTESKYKDVSSIYKSKEKTNYQTEIQTKISDVVEKDPPKLFNFSTPFESESKSEISILDDMPPLENIDGASIFQESREDLKDDFDFPLLDDKIDVDKELEFKTDMFEDASDCCDNLIYKNEENALSDVKKSSKTDVISEEKVVTAKTRKPKTKLGVRIPNKHFPTKNEDMDAWTPKNPWNSVTNTKPKEKTLDLSQKENCDLLDVSDDKSTKKSYTSAVKSVKLIHIETPADEEAAIEIVEPPLPEYRNNTWYPNIIEKSSDDEKNIEGSPGETTESDDSGKLLENQVTEDLTSQCVIQTVSKTNKKKSKKKRK